MFAECVLHTLEIRHKEVAFLLLEPLEERVESTKLGDCPRVFKTANDYLITLYDVEELSSEATIRKFQTVQTEGNRQVARLVEPYRLEAILSVGYRMRFQRGVQFRRWATSQLQEHPCQ